MRGRGSRWRCFLFVLGVFPCRESRGGFLLQRRDTRETVQKPAMRGGVQKPMRFKLAVNFQQPFAELFQEADADRLIIHKGAAFAKVACHR